MPCSRSARRPSVNRAKSSEPADWFTEAFRTEARGWLGENGYDPHFGARPMARLVDQQLKKALADSLLFGELRAGGIARFELNEAKDGLRFRALPLMVA